jgi:hypothetical protein
MCEEYRIIPVEFDGNNDAMFHSNNRDGKLHIEYLEKLGNYCDVPFDRVWDSLVQIYGKPKTETQGIKLTNSKISKG